tara:strand:- start:318 stop:545 length:228 start_codon:yes stop_codon:yes gene_type:complete
MTWQKILKKYDREKELELLKMLKHNLDAYLKDTSTIIDIREDGGFDELTQHLDSRSRSNIYSIIDDLLLLKKVEL